MMESGTALADAVRLFGRGVVMPYARGEATMCFCAWCVASFEATQHQ